MSSNTSAGAQSKHSAKLAADHAAKVADLKRCYPTEPRLVMAGEVGFLQGRADHLARELDKAEAARQPRVIGDHSLCASTLRGVAVALEYSVGREFDGKPECLVEAIHIGGARIEIAPDEFTDWQINKWAEDAEAAEMASGGDFDEPDFDLDFGDSAGRAEDAYIAQRDHAHYARAA